MERLAFRLTFSLVVLLGFAIPSPGQNCSDCEIPNGVRTSRIQLADDALTAAAANTAAIVSRHFPFGLPETAAESGGEKIIVQFEWLARYDADLRIPLWVGYELSSVDANNKAFPRVDCFRRDVRLTDDEASFCEDYDEPLYDRGHMVPANDSRRNQTMIDNSFLFSNMAPQRGNFNRIIWERLESTVHGWAQSVGVYIITGAIFDRNNDKQRDPDDQAIRMKPRRRVAVPSHFYKIVTHVRTDGQIDTISFLLPHNNRVQKNKTRYLNSKIVSIDEIEQRTGTDFFPNMEASRQAELESTKAVSMTRWLTK
jgi:DNA/RNA endonuclease G (NUC1)